MNAQLLELQPSAVPQGLDKAEVETRVARGEINDTSTRTSRSGAEIVRANLFTRFNALLGALFVVMLIIGPPQDALFGLVLVANLLIGISQELRAKVTLDHLAVVHAPSARVFRSGNRTTLPVSQLVKDDWIEARRGDQIPVDGRLIASDNLEVDESLLTGESQPIAKDAGDALLSGSIVTAGSGVFRATAVGRQAYARQLAEQARRFSLVHSELRDGINRMLKVITWIIPPTAVLLIISQLRANDHLADAIRGAVAGTVTLVPEGLVLLTSLAMAVAVGRLVRRGALVQELPAVEGLARVDVVCLDKTGTLTEGDMAFHQLKLLDTGYSEAQLAPVLAALSGADEESNQSLRALHATYRDDSLPVRSRVPFSSARKWSAIGTDGGDAWYLGAPEVLGRGQPAILEAAEREASAGFRVLMLARGGAPARAERLPAALDPVALLLLSERIRPDAAQTLEYFSRQGIAVKVISGDHPATIRAIASRVNLPGGGSAIDGPALPATLADLAPVVDEHAVFARIAPAQKRKIVQALRTRGHVVAMVGDGVNDVLALKDADIAVAMASGTAATRAVAQVVLLDNQFSALPAVIGEGRRVIANIERLANLFITKTVYAFLLAVAVGIMAFPFPFLPRHLTIVGSLSIGIPAFFLALAPNAQRARPGFVNRVLRFSIPAGIVAAAATFGAYALVLDSPYASFAEAQTMATMVLVGVGFWLLTVLARPFTVWKTALVSAMIAAFILILALPLGRRFFALDIPSILVTLAALGIVAIAGALIELGWRFSRWEATLRERTSGIHRR